MQNKFSSSVELSSGDFTYKDSNFYIKNTGNKKGLMLVYAAWCGYCKMIAPVWKKFIKEQGKDFIIKALHIEGSSSNKDLAGKLGVEGYPTILYINKDGKVGGKFEGERNIQEFIKYLKNK